jgi:hypothetical protein
MSSFQSRAQKRASKQRALRNERIQKFVAEQLRDYDTERRGQPKDHVAREAFAKLVHTRALATLAG